MTPKEALTGLFQFTGRERTTNRAFNVPPSLPLREERMRVLRAARHGEKFLNFLNEVDAYRVEGIEENLNRYEALLDFLIHPDAAAATKRISEAVGDNRFAFVVVGSGAQGGMWIRDLSGAVVPGESMSDPLHQDLDIALLYDSGRKPSGGELDQLQSTVSKVAETSGDNLFRNGFVLCGLFKAEEKQRPMVTKDNVGRLVSANFSSLQSTLDTYFHISFPTEVNIKARRLILEEIGRLAQENQKEWYRCCSAIVDSVLARGWEGFAKEKYFHKKGTQSDFFQGTKGQEFTHLRWFFEGRFRSIFVNLLEATNPNPDKPILF